MIGMGEHQELHHELYIHQPARIVLDIEQLRRAMVHIAHFLSHLVHFRAQLFDIKHDPGGLVDVEFMVQFLVLAHADYFPQLAENIGNLALLQRTGELGLIETEAAQQISDAYRMLRRQQHRLKIQGMEKAQIAPDVLTDHTRAVTALWHSLMG